MIQKENKPKHFADRSKEKKKTFDRLIGELSRDPRCQQMKEFTQHGRVSTYDHCMSVARTSFQIGRLLPFKMNERELVRGAFLHDYYLYDWHHCDEKWHGFRHPRTAARNAKRDFSVSDREKNIIESHMWPLTIRTFPKSKEAVCVCLADKFCSLKETLLNRKK